MNITLQCCSLFVLTIIYIMYLHEKKLDLTNRTLFLRALGICYLGLIFDILSVVAICMSGTVFHPFAVKMICKFYIFLLMMQGYFGYVYVMTGLFVEKKYNPVKRIYHMLFTVSNIAVLFVPISYERRGNSVYSHGPAAILAYAFVGFYILTIIIIAYTHKEYFTKRQLLTIYTWQGIWTIAGIIQLIFPTLLLMGFASAFGIVVLYTQLENPGEFIDDETGNFDHDALLIYIDDRYKYKKQFTILMLQIGYTTSNIDFELEHKAKSKISHILRKITKSPVFKVGDDTFCIIYKNDRMVEEQIYDIKSSIRELRDIPLNVKYIAIMDGFEFQGPKELLGYMHKDGIFAEEILYVDEDILNKIRAHNKMSELINDALKNDRVEVFYQPFYHILSKRFTAAEALVRIRDEKGKIISPGEFIPVAEETGQIIPLGMRIFDKVCQFIHEQKPQSLGLRFIEVNISAAQFDHMNPANFVKDGIKKYGIDPGMINLEITETAQSENKKIVLDNVNSLLKSGVSFSLDDFGTGRSNLDYFIDLPVKNVKFDYIFTQEYFRNERIRHILEGMIDIIHKMDMHIVTEGIETKEQF